MENWFKGLLSLDNYRYLAHHNKNDEPNTTIVFPRKSRFKHYESLGESKGEVCFIKPYNFKKYMGEKEQESLLEIVPCEKFTLEINNSQQLRGINSKTWEKRSFHEDYGVAKYLNIDYKLDGGNYSLFCLGRNIKHEYKDSSGEGYSYVMIYFDEIMNMVVIFKSTYHEVGKRDLSFKTFQESNQESTTGSVDILNIETLSNSDPVDTDYLFTAMSNSNMFVDLLKHPVFKHELMANTSLKYQITALNNIINPKKRSSFFSSKRSDTR
jgi:hypothetical protein